MSLTAEALRKLASLGLTQEQLSGVLDVIADVEQSEADRKAKQRERTRKHRSQRDRNVTVTVTERDGNCDTSPEVLDKERSPTPPKENSTPTPFTTQQGARELSISDISAMSVLMFQAGGDALNRTAAALESMAIPLGWLRSGADLHLDILPAVRRLCSRSPPGRLKSWAFFSDAVAEALADRMQLLPPGTARHVPPSVAERTRRLLDRVAADEGSDGQPGGSEHEPIIVQFAAR